MLTYDFFLFVSRPLDAVNVKKRRADPDEEFEATSAPIGGRPVSDRARLVDIADRTGMPLSVLERKEAEAGKLILRGAELGYLDQRGMFICWVSAGD